MSDDVYIVGAGFSAGLGYPLLNNLLEFIWDDFSDSDKEKIADVVKFHNPEFVPNHPFTFPDIETLLTQFESNIELFNFTRNVEGNFKLKDLIEVRDILLIQMAKRFHETNNKVTLEEYPWLKEFTQKVKSNKSTIISFNYDLVLEKFLFGTELCPEDYGFNEEEGRVSILKPHGSLNWFLQDETTGQLKSKKKEQLTPKDKIWMFKARRHPNSKTNKTYAPYLIPPTFTKKFEGEVYEKTFRKSVSILSKAKNVYFLGCSLPKSDFHTQYMLRCGFHNQIKGEIIKENKRSKPTGAANIIVVNPSKNAAKNTEKLISTKHRFIWHNKNLENWVNESRSS